MSRRHPSGDSVAHTVVQRVAGIVGREVTQLPPLYETIDPEALDRLIGSIPTDDECFSIQFVYAGQRVTVESSGVVTVHGE